MKSKFTLQYKERKLRNNWWLWYCHRRLSSNEMDFVFGYIQADEQGNNISDETFEKE